MEEKVSESANAAEASPAAKLIIRIGRANINMLLPEFQKAASRSVFSRCE
jgi:hypothetical protein